MRPKNLLMLALICAWWSACFKKHPINANALLQQRTCLESLELKDYLRAQMHCELCLEYDASMPECLNGLGLVALSAKDEQKAINYFSKALRQNNDFSEARNNLGVIYFSRGEFATALKYFDRALEIDPSNGDARYNSGLSHFRLAQRNRASEHALKTLRHLDKAREQITKLLALEPDYQSAYRDLGLIALNRYDLSEYEHQRQALLKEAQSSFERCLSLDNDNDGCYEGLGQVFLESGHFDKAFSYYFLCLTHAPDNSACRSDIVRAFEKSAQAEGGYQNFRRQIKNEPKNAFAHEAFCAALFERGLDSEARAQCQMAVKLKPDLCSAHFRLADHFATVFNAELANKHCREFLVCDGTKETAINQKRCREILLSLKHERS